MSRFHDSRSPHTRSNWRCLGNLLGHNVLRDAFTRGGPETHLRPVMAMEEFNLPRRQ